MKQKIVFFLSLFLIVGGSVYAQKPTAAKSVGPRNAIMTQYDYFDYTYNIYKTNLTQCKLVKVSNNHYNITIISSDTDKGTKGGKVFHVLNVDFGSNTNIVGTHTIVQETSVANKNTNESYLMDTDPSMNYIPYGTITFTHTTGKNYTIAIDVKAYNYYDSDYYGYKFTFDGNPTLPVYAYDTDGITPITLDGDDTGGGSGTGGGTDQPGPSPSEMDYSDYDNVVNYTMGLEGKNNVAFACPATSPSYFVVTKQSATKYRISSYLYGGSGNNDYSYRTQLDLIVNTASDCDGIPSGTYTLQNANTAGTAILPTYTGEPTIEDGITNISGCFADIDYVNWGTQIFWTWMMTSGTIDVTHVDENYYVNVTAKNSFNYNVNYTIGTAPKTITLNAGDNGSAKIVYKSATCWNDKEYATGENKFFAGQTISLEATADDGYEFDQWNDGNKDNPRQITVSSAATYTASFKATSTGLTLKDNEDNAATLASKDGQTMDVTINRTIKAGMWNTICLPFALSSLVSTPLAGAQLGTLTQAETVDDELVLDFATTETTVAAGKPYIIKLAGASDLVNPTFTSVTIDKSNADYTVDEIDFKGVYSPVDLQATDLFLGVNNTVHNPTANNTMNGFRAYFHYTSKAGIPRRIRMVVNSSETTTALDDFSAETVITKTLENGRLVIIRDGVRYDAQGCVIK